MEHVKKDNGDELWQVGNESLLRTLLGHWELFELNQPEGVPQKQPRSLRESEALEVLERFGARHAFQVEQAHEELAAAKVRSSEACHAWAVACNRVSAARDALRALGEEF